MTGRRWLVSGIVQGVGYRWFVLRQARRLGLVGYARNLPDGRVEVSAMGLDSALAEMAALLASGPAASRVDGVLEADYPHETESYNTFSII